MPTYLVRLAQIHESFRKAELHALAELVGVKLEIIQYDDDVGGNLFLQVNLRFLFTSIIGHFLKQDSFQSFRIFP